MINSRLVGWFCDPQISEVSGIAQSGANAVAMGPYCIMERWDGSTIGNMVGNSTQYALAMRSARQQGLKVLLKPIIDCSSYAGQPNSAGWRISIDPADMAAWIESYYNICFAPYLDLVDMIAIHTELVTISSNYPALMVELIQQIRMAGFSGPITTSSDFNPSNCPYWTALDCIGADAYPTIRSDSVSDAIEDWTPIAQQAAVAYAQTGCNTIFGELCPNYNVNLTAHQVNNVYTAFWEVFGSLSHWAGALAWRWPQDGSTPPPALMTALSSGVTKYSSYSAPSAVSGA